MEKTYGINIRIRGLESPAGPTDWREKGAGLRHRNSQGQDHEI